MRRHQNEAVSDRLANRLRRADATTVFVVVVLAAVVGGHELARAWSAPRAQAWATVFVALCVQATPYVVLGVVLSALLAAVPPTVFARIVPRRPSIAVPAAALAGLALPGCECGSVPVAAGLMRRGVSTGPAVAFMLAAPAANPVVLAATAAAFPGRPAVVVARLVSALAVATIAGLVGQARFRETLVLQGAAVCDHGRSIAALTVGALDDLGRALGLVVIAAAGAAAVNVLAPRALLDGLGSTYVGAVATTAVLAVLLAVCSQADAFVASSLTAFSAVAQLTFMVVGPVVDLKLIGMQAGAFGARFAARLSATCFAVSVVVSLVVGAVLL